MNQTKAGSKLSFSDGGKVLAGIANKSYGILTLS